MTKRGIAFLAGLALAGCMEKEAELMVAPPPVAAGLLEVVCPRPGRSLAKLLSEDLP